MKKVMSFSLSRMRTEEDFGFMRLTNGEIPKLTSAGDDGGGDESLPDIQSLAQRSVSPVLQERINTFQAALEEFDNALKDSASVPASALVIEGDERRDAAWRGLRNYAKAMTAHPEADVAAVAEEIIAILDKYGDPTSLSYNEESGIIHNAVQDIEALSDEKRTSVAIDVWANALNTENTNFNEALKLRGEQKGARTTGIVKQTRQETDDAYRALISTVNALVEIEGEENYAAFIDSMNVHIASQKATLKLRSTVNSKAGDDDEDDEPDDKPVVQ